MLEEKKFKNTAQLISRSPALHRHFLDQMFELFHTIWCVPVPPTTCLPSKDSNTRYTTVLHYSRCCVMKNVWMYLFSFSKNKRWENLFLNGLFRVCRIWREKKITFTFLFGTAITSIVLLYRLFPGFLPRSTSDSFL